jgi:hypothetical protein
MLKAEKLYIIGNANGNMNELKKRRKQNVLKDLPVFFTYIAD